MESRNEDLGSHSESHWKFEKIWVKNMTPANRKYSFIDNSTTNL